MFLFSKYRMFHILPQIVYCKSRNLHNTDVSNYSRDLRQFLRHPVVGKCFKDLKYSYVDPDPTSDLDKDPDLVGKALIT